MSILTDLVDALQEGQIRVVDLTQPLGEETPVIGLPEPFAPSPGFSQETISEYDEGGPAWYWNTITLGEHTGTHFDAPIHWITGRDLPENTTDTIAPERFVGPACVIDVSPQVAEDEGFCLSRADVEAWEEEHGPIPEGAWLLLRTDWSQRQGAKAFLNVGEEGPQSPGFEVECARFLAEERDILGVGVETVGTDAGAAGGFEPPFPTHTFMHGAGKYGLASLTNLDQLPPTGAVVIAAPLKIVRGSGSPLRVLALVPG